MAERLRVGILCDGLVFHHWQAECIRKVLDVPGVEPAVVIIQDKDPDTTRKPDLRYALYRWFRRDRLRVKALVPEDLSGLLEAVPKLHGRPNGRSSTHRFNEDEITAIKNHAPDVLLCFGSRILEGAILTVARYGVWGYHHGDADEFRGRPVGFWEIMEDHPVTGAALRRFTDDVDAGFVLRKGWFRTVSHSLSQNIDQVMLNSTDWMAQVCRDVLYGRPEAAQGTASKSDAPLNRIPRNMDLLRFLLVCNRNRIAFERSGSAQRDEWNIGVLYQPIASLLVEKPSLNVRWLPAPGPGQLRAAPSGYVADGQLNMLYGKYDASTDKGEICRLRPKRDNVLKRSRTMLANEHLLSHPFLFQHEGQWLVVPQSSAGRVDLFRIDAANEAMEFVRTLLDEPLSSPTVFEHGGLWWLFGTKAPLEEVALCAYHARSLEGPWIPHAMNPLKLDVRSARPAGTPFTHEGQLYRPAQDHSRAKGWRVALLRVLELTPTAFREELVRTIGPLKGSAWSHGTGTLSAVGDLTLVDGKRPMSAHSGKSPRRSSKGKSASAKHTSSERQRDLDGDEDED